MAENIASENRVRTFKKSTGTWGTRIPGVSGSFIPDPSAPQSPLIPKGTLGQIPSAFKQTLGETGAEFGRVGSDLPKVASTFNRYASSGLSDLIPGSTSEAPSTLTGKVLNPLAAAGGFMAGLPQRAGTMAATQTAKFIPKIFGKSMASKGAGRVAEGAIAGGVSGGLTPGSLEERKQGALLGGAGGGLLGGMNAAGAGIKKGFDFAKKKLVTPNVSQLDEAALSSIKSAKEPVKKLFTEQGNKYRNLWDSAIEKAPDELITADEVVAKVMSDYGDDQFAANGVLDAIGVKPGSKDIFTTRKLAEMFKKAGAKIPLGQRAGTSISSSKSVVQNQARGVISDILEERGVDLGEASKFWKEWKPYQKQLMKDVKPFDQEGASGFSSGISKLRQAATGDIGNRDYFNTLKDRYGIDLLGSLKEPAGREIRANKLARGAKIVGIGSTVAGLGLGGAGMLAKALRRD